MATDKPDKTTAPASAPDAPPSATPAEPEKKVRSETPYPYFGLTKVIDIVKAVQRVSGNAPAPAAALLAELGIAKTDRLWAYGIPAAVYFGLVERIGRGDDAQVKLTDLGKRVALPGTPDEERVTKATAVKTPELYGRLLEQFAGAPMPTKEALKNILQRDYKIVESMAGNAADAFLDSLKVAELVTAGGVVTVDNTPRTDEKAKLEKTGEGGDDGRGAPDEFIRHVFQLRRDLKITLPLPPDLTKKDVERINRWMQTLPIEDME